MTAPELRAHLDESQRQIGRAVRQLRQRRRMTMDDLAAAAGVAHNTIVRVEHGENVRTRNLFKLLLALEGEITIHEEAGPCTCD